MLIHCGGSEAASSRPWITALAISHADTVSSIGHRQATAATATPIEATASANTPTGSIGGMSASDGR